MSFNILVVDDNRENLRVVGSLLHDKEYNVVVVDNGKDAIGYSATNPPDLILMDIMMPDEDGYSVCKKLKRRNSTKNIPIIFLTARNDPESLEKAFEVGGIDYIAKPFNKNELLARVKAQLELQKAYREINQLRGLLPICAHCKKIRDVHGYWHEIEEYFATRSEVDFSHGICDECAEELYPEYMARKHEKENQ